MLSARGDNAMVACARAARFVNRSMAAALMAATPHCVFKMGVPTPLTFRKSTMSKLLTGLIAGAFAIAGPPSKGGPVRRLPFSE